MYLTMNRFKVKLGSEEAFETVWKSRDSHLKEVPGFMEFHLMKGPQNEEAGYRLYASHTMWESEEAFLGWTKSEAFRKAHAGARSSADIYMGPPELEIFDSIQSVR
ncbi:antibiotic biosynthesis monooxygenase [Poseidonocella sp. HB161398]|uniref:antibiotic biosynthesis monooxygenase family protein n=1 Tax=Poseidonocella sp. HB161398 TaxID=2320855 RepID=UPI001107CBD2|nr:antibiotic biosynthesis monooxygenase [Poseidonocella sp. HB161398]